MVFFAATASAQPTTVQRVVMSPKFQAAEDFVVKDHERFIREIIQITEIEAPPFKETRRGVAFAEMLRQNGLTDIETDPEGNVIGVRKGTGNGPLVAIAAHLDTVFPEGTNVKVRHEGSRLFAPGVAVDSANDVQRRRDWWGDVREFDSVRILDGSRYSLREQRGTQQGGGYIHAVDARGRGGGKPLAVDRTGKNRSGREADR